MLSAGMLAVILLSITASLIYLGSTKRNYMLVFANYCDVIDGEVLQINDTVFDYDFKVQLSTGDVVSCTATSKYGKRVGDNIFVCKSDHCAYLLDELLDVSGCEEALKERDLIQ